MDLQDFWSPRKFCFTLEIWKKMVSKDFGGKKGSSEEVLLYLENEVEKFKEVLLYWIRGKSGFPKEVLLYIRVINRW